jgi:glucose-1-phosphate thymidylyltransferase
MKAVVLAAGYATRLYPLTRDRPKPLLEVGGRPILARLLEHFDAVEELDRVYVVTNGKFAERFREFASGWEGRLEISVVDDGTTSDETKLGAIGDLELVIRREGVEDDLLVAAGDSIFDRPRLEHFVRLGHERRAPVVAVREVEDREQLKAYSVLTTDGDGRILAFQEKPEEPTGTLAGIALYFYPRAVLPLIRRYIDEGNNADQPGRLVEWMYTRVPFYTWRLEGRWFDIGSKDTLAAADREFSQS